MLLVGFIENLAGERAGDRGAVRRFALDSGVSPLRPRRGHAGPFELHGDSAAPAGGRVRRRVRVRASGPQEEESAQGPSTGDRHIGAGGERITALARAPADGRAIPGVCEALGGGGARGRDGPARRECL